jgi:catechol 2,3-dioxygenase-like lactoylglutathione lyase family enzyme
MSTPYYKFDGGFIMVPWDQFEQAVEWYRERMGWKLKGVADTPVGRKAFFRMPDMGQANLKSFESSIDHFTLNNYAEGHCRFCFRTANLEEALRYYQEQGVECSASREMPDGTLSADILAFGGVRLTLSEDRKFEGKHPESRIIRYADKPLWLGVTDLAKAEAWYEKVFGFVRAKKQYADKRFVLLRDVKAKWSYVWLEQLPVGTQPVKANPGSRLYFQVKRQEDFFEAHRWLKGQGIEVSDVVGTRWQGFHFYDPDGNRLNVWTY